MTKECIDFVNLHRDEDTARLLLSAARYPNIDMATAVNQIEGLKMAAVKWPSLLQHEGFEYPPRLNREQASSEATARYKASLLSTLHSPLSTLADLTGGMGIDSLAFAAAGFSVDYVERDPQLCDLMRHNAEAIHNNPNAQIPPIAVHCADCIEWLTASSRIFDVIFLDPARRAASGRKVSAFEDCQPDILRCLDLLRSHCRWLMVKASPMIDIDLAIEQLGAVAQVHVVALKGECKEVLFICGDDAKSEPIIHCVDLKDSKDLNAFVFTRSEELGAQPAFCVAVKKYLYEPNAALMKGGCFSLVATRFGLEKLAPNTHLYTSGSMVTDFPGRVFEVQQEVALSRKALSRLLPEGKASVTVRNYPDEAAVLQRRLGLKEGGDFVVVAATVGRRPTGFLCRRLPH